jgi:hypothetical protein
MSETFTPSPIPTNQGNAPLPVKRGAGGTPGGIGTFFIGVILAAIGGYLITNQVTVTGAFNFFGGRFGGGGFGLTMLPLLIGIGALFFNGKSILGWLLTVGGVGIILASVLMNMRIYWQSTTLFNTVIMWGMLAAGLGLVFRSLRAYPPPER